MIDATIDMLRARHDEQVALIGVVAGIVCDDLQDGVRRLECIRDAAKECERNAARTDRQKKRIYRQVASTADELIPGVRQLAGLFTPAITATQEREET